MWPRSLITMSPTPVRDYKVIKHYFKSNLIAAQSAIETLNSLQGRAQAGGAEKLKETTKYLDRCGVSLDKLDEVPVIHVTGTHGKGSTCAYCESILSGCGYKTGFYSSPHLLEVRERIRIGGKALSQAGFAEYFWTVYDMLDEQKNDSNDVPLYFKFLTTLAFYVFLQERVDVAIVEVGIGGEFDCTNVLRKPTVCGVATIGLDHTAMLGTTVESVAWHKAGIMKAGSVAVTVDQPDNVLQVLRERSVEKNCRLRILREETLRLDCGVQSTNVNLAVALTQEFLASRTCKSRPLEPDFVLRCVRATQWPGRYQVKQVKNVRFFLDGAHTLGSVETCAGWFRRETSQSTKTKVLVFNLTGARESEAFLKPLAACAFGEAIFTPNVGYETQSTDTTDYKLTLDTQLGRCEEYKEKWRELGNDEAKATVCRSFAHVVSHLGDRDEYDVLVTGSLYLVGAALSVLDPTLDGTLSFCD